MVPENLDVNQIKCILQNVLVGIQMLSLTPDKQEYQIHIFIRPLD